ncbi:uncharacterized protein LOC131006029 isoform X5 [Salvia miltiorrhiza]|uniref:uncharacterized protein LOC131006029 isoform X5 n=1 Tax=Salvia miltiorrhiza TaxID=226208 RepID=UPI0025AD1863|nr:uncharacterized protein LOC131006029 isoform X5 [Salvia miltiorrhiza]
MIVLPNIHQTPKVALVHGISMGEGASLMVPMKFSVVTEKSKDLNTKIEKSRKQIKECKNRAKKICGVKKMEVWMDGLLLT